MTGQRLGVSPWHAVTQEQVNLFADATHDHQWIHVDPERAARGPFGGPIAHGYLTLAMLPALLSPMLRVSGVALSVNYGLNRVRFTSPVRIGARVRAVADVLRVDAVEGGVQVHLSVTVEIEGCDKPACVAETITRLYREQVRKVEEAKE
ncbi:MAG: MaoC family dehydratase [Candidatus Dormibacteraeota bacterium]|jgi:acyl dehydratase|nr:MaoC family dehydratase [Candidatus Dormibacteraeota bacterium]